MKPQTPDPLPPEVPVQRPATRPDDRYGAASRPAGRGLVVAVVLVAAAFLGWVGWAAVSSAGRGARAEVTAFRVLSDRRIAVQVAASAAASGQLSCRLRALDRTHDVVGVAGVVLDGDSPAGREARVIVRTRARAVTATVSTCSTASD